MGLPLPSTRWATFSMERTLFYRITQYAEGVGKSRNSWVVELLEREMDRLGVVISKENSERANEETRAEVERRKSIHREPKRRGRPPKNKSDKAK